MVYRTPNLIPISTNMPPTQAQLDARLSPTPSTLQIPGGIFTNAYDQTGSNIYIKSAGSDPTYSSINLLGLGQKQYSDLLSSNGLNPGAGVSADVTFGLNDPKVAQLQQAGIQFKKMGNQYYVAPPSSADLINSGRSYLSSQGVDLSNVQSTKFDALSKANISDISDIGQIKSLFAAPTQSGSSILQNNTPNAIASPAELAAAAAATGKQLASDQGMNVVSTVDANGNIVSTNKVPLATAATTASTALQGAGATQSQADALAHAAVTPNDPTYAAAAGYTGPSVVDFLNTAGQPSDLNSRAQLAAKFGVVPNAQAYINAANAGTNGDMNTQLLNLLKGHTVAVSPTGLPANTSSVLGTPGSGSTASSGPSTPMDLSSLSGNGNLDIGKILGVGSAAGSDISSQIAGLLGLYSASTTQQKTYEDDSKRLIDAMTSLGGESGDLKSALDTAGVPAAQQHLQDLNLQAAQLKGDLDKFDAETLAQKEGITNQAIPQGLVQGQQAAFQKQRDLTRLGKAAELSSVTALMTAYQGNIDTAMKLAQQSVDFKYAPIENQIKVLQQQLAIDKDSKDTADSKNNTIIGKLLDIKMSQITDQKTNDKTLQTIGVQAAAGGAPLATVKAATATGDPVTAATQLAQWLKGPTESVTGSGGGTFTSTQLNSGAANAGMAIADFKALDADTQNYFINSASQIKDIQSKLSSGEYTKQDVSAQLQSSSNVPAAAKPILLKLLGVSATADTGSGGGFFSGIASFLGHPFGM